MCPILKTLLVRGASLFLLLAAGSQSELFCQNAVANGQFDSDLSSWSAVSGIGFAHWDSLDADGSPHSGSVLISNDALSDHEDTSIDQCVSITAGKSYFFAADIHPDNITPLGPSGTRQPLHTGQAYVLFNFYSRPSCGGVPSGDFVFLGADSNNEWQSLARNFITPPSAVSALVTVSVLKGPGGGNVSAHFDNIFLVPPSIPTVTPIPPPTPIPTATPTAVTTVPPTPTATPPATPTPSPRLPRVVPFR